MTYIRWFDEVGAADVGLVGGKAANLGEMVAAGWACILLIVGPSLGQSFG